MKLLNPNLHFIFPSLNLWPLYIQVSNNVLFVSLIQVKQLKEKVEEDKGKDYPAAAQKLIYSGKFLGVSFKNSLSIVVIVDKLKLSEMANLRNLPFCFLRPLN